MSAAIEEEKVDWSKVPVLNPHRVKQRFRRFFSVTQVETWRLCKRKWGYAQLDKLRYANKYAERGKQVHKIAELWLKDGIPPDTTTRYGRMVNAGTKHLPLPGTALVEYPFIYVTKNGIAYCGNIDATKYADLYDPQKNLTVDPQRGCIWDHKSTTSFDWALTPETLRINVQSNVYGAAIVALLDVQYVDLRWVYYEDVNKNPRALPVDATVDLKHIETQLEQIDATAEEIGLHGLTQKCASDLEPNGGACRAYGGCPYQDICPISDGERLQAYMTQLSIREQLMQKAAKNGAAPASQTAATPAASTPAASTPAPSTAPSSGMSALERMRANAKSQAPANAPPAGAPAATVQTQAPAPAGGSLLERMKAKAAGAAPQSQPVEQQRANYAPTDINPPEQPTNPIDDADEVAANNEAAKAGQNPEQAAPKTRGRKPAATAPVAQMLTQTGLSDEGFIFGHVYSEALRETKGDIEIAAEAATNAVHIFRQIPAKGL